ncbi:DNA-directed RNA polymerase subunit delta [[Acholeplasma] multilocale]|uniref:DNA-directed RNA polymerase subunit delta n=1 Tax=[Acholeplasma] multilocale TaxID=264638 RepID=UPI00047E6128|nr:DNA-directed RNA polymerase subunit delta [[Acholeplasma] multilocale]
MAKLSNIDLAFEYLKGKNGPAVFADIWNGISSEITAQKKNEKAIIADLYGDMVLDNRFSLSQDGTWALRDSAKTEDIKTKYAAAEAATKKVKDSDIDGVDADGEDLDDFEDDEEEFEDDEEIEDIDPEDSYDDQDN